MLIVVRGMLTAIMNAHDDDHALVVYIPCDHVDLDVCDCRGTSVFVWMQVVWRQSDDQR